MIKPPTPVDELLRLETLRNLKIFDTDPEERFDRVTRLAKWIFGTPIALVSLVDSDRQWFKSRQGLDAAETPRDISFCGHAVLENETFIANNTHDDERFSDNPLVVNDPRIRFYAGCPVRAPNGKKIGTLCIIDRKPRELCDADGGPLEELGQMFEEELVVADIVHNDPVTGLCNASGFQSIADYLLAMCRRTQSPASLLLFHFTNQHLIEGFMGRDESDRAAIELAQLLMASFRDSDVVGRISENTFAVLLAGSQTDEIEPARRRLMERLTARADESNSEYALDVESHAIDYDTAHHDDAAILIRDATDAMQSHGTDFDPGEQKLA